jgi:hypothetical protein
VKGLETGTTVILQLSSPREQVFGIISHLDASGVLLRSISVESVDDWIRSVAALQREDGEETLVLSMTFFPMHRLERILLDEASSAVPALHERFAERVGYPLDEHVAERYPDVRRG